MSAITDSSSINLSLTNIYASWRAFRAAKKPSRAIILFEAELELNLLKLCAELNSDNYRHAAYEHRIINEKKRRDIAVASVCDRVVHRLLYDYLVPIYDRTFIYDIWSCRPGKGLQAAIDRAQNLMRKHRQGWLWRADILKFFDSVDQIKMKNLLRRRVSDRAALDLFDEVINSYQSELDRQTDRQTDRGLPIGNLTSQIFANIYLNELDRFVVHNLKPLAYMRYGDDFLCFAACQQQADDYQLAAEQFLQTELALTVNPKLNYLKPTYRGISYLGVDIWANGRRLMPKVRKRIRKRLDSANAASYKALVQAHEKPKYIKQLNWILAAETID